MYDAGTVRSSIRSLCHSAVNEHRYSPEAAAALLREVDCNVLAMVFQHTARRVYAFETRGRYPLSLHYRGRDLFGQRAVRLYADMDAFTSGNPMASHAMEVWLKEDGNLIAASCVRMHYRPGEYDTEYREIQGAPWTCGLELKLKALKDNLRHLSRGAEFDQ